MKNSFHFLFEILLTIKVYCITCVMKSEERDCKQRIGQEKEQSDHQNPSPPCRIAVVTMVFIMVMTMTASIYGHMCAKH